MSRQHLGPNQKQILAILDAYPKSTTMEIAQLVFNREVKYHSAEFGSISRSLRLLEQRGLVKRIGGKILWRKTQ